MSSGCTSDEELDEPVQFCLATIQNMDESNSYNIRAQIVDEDELVYEVTKKLSPLGVSHNLNPTTISITRSDLPSREGAFKFRVKVDSSEWKSIDMTAIYADSIPVGVQAVITEEEEVSFFKLDPENREYDC
ncbi:hypothetical protein [Natrialba sp. SSL1]|uniref:hypothetical protein n=1 Tax=Natrialba sp. SSL1 TaxID=1869245 RepID=UPI00111449B7|nr:hypothetical protein [Natrialba sp. SSL1]